jgi:hypothetical protein
MATIETEARVDAELEHLEELWRLEPARVRRRLRLGNVEDAELALKVLLWCWLAFLSLALIFEPAPAAGVVPPLYWQVASVLFWTLAPAAFLARMFAGPRAACVLASFMGASGVVMGIGCRTSGHHLGTWWMVETGVAAVFTLYPISALLRFERMPPR